ncbi:hypothetical protein ACVWWP_000330 [Bradyrhizobium sp. LM3.6]
MVGDIERNQQQSLSASVSVGLVFAVIQITNLLLPGFVSHSLGGGSRLFGTLEMTAAIAGMAALAAAGIPAVARRMARMTTPLVAGAAGSLLILGFATDPLVAIVLYAAAGMLWNLSRAAANGDLLTVVDSALIGRVQAFTSLLTGAVGALIFLLPTLLPNTTEAQLYMACGVMILVATALLASLDSPRQTRSHLTGQHRRWAMPPSSGAEGRHRGRSRTISPGILLSIADFSPLAQRRQYCRRRQFSRARRGLVSRQHPPPQP